MSAAAYGVLCWLSRTGHVPLWAFFTIMGLTAAAWIAAWRGARNAGPSVLLWAVIFRVIGFAGQPIYEDDFYRYLWDGRTFALTGDPYSQPPSASFGNDSIQPPFNDILGRINYPDIPTIYGPLTELTFLLSYWIRPGELWPLKLLYLAADLGILWLLWRRMPGSPNLILYAWCPLLIKEVAFTAHTDVLGALFAVAAIGGGGIALGLGIASRITCGVAAPALLGAGLRPWLACALTALAAYLPFVVRGAEGGGLGAFAGEWEFNSFVYAVVRATGGRTAAAAICVLLYAGFVGYLWLRQRDLLQPDVLIGAFFLIAPVVNPWYLILLVPFVALRPSGWGIGACVAVLISYATGMNLGRADIGRFDHPAWVRPAELAVIAVFALAAQLYGLSKSEGRATGASALATRP